LGEGLAVIEKLRFQDRFYEGFLDGASMHGLRPLIDERPRIAPGRSVTPKRLSVKVKKEAD